MQVIESRLRRHRWGEYHDADRTIVLALGMTRRAQRSVLAHECQHAQARDVHSMFGPIDRRQERRARLAASRLLITASEYAAAEALYGPHDAFLADELDVIPEVLRDWRQAVAWQPFASLTAF